MIDYDAQVRDLVRYTNHGLDQVRPRIGGVQHQGRVRQQFQAGDKFWLAEFRADVPAPQIPIANAAKQRVAVITLQILRKLRLARLQVPHRADNNGVLGRDVQDPEVVFDPRARFDLDSADNS